ncbi:MAG: cob(I)yrinic acid a,c-diamide adenosyltransferase [Candidatus Omnitrophica bacterium CG1_02_46_14]|nr:MAG: cob(I)yrinic acid a,c-diamide adenosyltransferase [Candidatus Omnitrophica bacterium CG1_02_46_14]
MKQRTGLLIVYTGDGKGKTTAALGAVFRALGHGWKVAVIQFVKGDWPIIYGEQESAKKFEENGQLLFVQKGTGFVKIMGDQKPIEIHVQAAKEALKFAESYICNPEYDLVVLDELNGAIEGGLIEVSSAIQTLSKRLDANYVIVTGRRAAPEILTLADLVTEMREIKHPFKEKKITAQLGIDY